VQAVKPVAVHTGVGVEPDDIAFRVQGHTAVHITDEAEVGRLAQVLQLAMAFTLPECGYEFGVWTGVVEDDEAMWGAVVCGVLIHAVDALECGLASFETGRARRPFACVRPCLCVPMRSMPQGGKHWHGGKRATDQGGPSAKRTCRASMACGSWARKPPWLIP